MTRHFSALLVCWLCGTTLSAQRFQYEGLRIDTLTLVDTVRGRSVPVACFDLRGPAAPHPKVVVLSHGYNENLPGTYLHYSYLTHALAMHGYFVVSIQHELPTDEPLAMKGDLRDLRRPNWERGAGNILFVLNELKRTRPTIDFSHTSLIGHSNGGDMSVLFAQQYPELVENLITLDNRRMPLPRTNKPRILSLRSSDAPADAGVLPTAEEQAAFGIRVIPLAEVKHNEMSDRANAEQRATISAHVAAFLNGRQP